MSAPVFSATEVLRFAVKNEQAGEAFYRQIARHTSDPDVRDLFELLAEEEPRHAVIFNRMLDALEPPDAVQTEMNEYVGYMLAYYQANILFADNLTEELPAKPDPVAALDFGIRRELDSIHYYTHAKILVPPGQAGQIDEIIAEERTHFLKLSKLKRTILAAAHQSHQGEPSSSGAPEKPPHEKEMT